MKTAYKYLFKILYNKLFKYRIVKVSLAGNKVPVFIIQSMFLLQEEKKLAYKAKLRELNVELTSDNEDEDDLT